MQKNLLATLVLMAMATVASAQTAPTLMPKDPTATNRLDKRLATQEKRVDQGIASGQLNSKEAARMESREAKLKSNVAAAKSNGKVTKKERAKLHHQADRNSKAIYRQKHDKQKASK